MPVRSLAATIKRWAHHDSLQQADGGARSLARFRRPLRAVGVLDEHRGGDERLGASGALRHVLAHGADTLQGVLTLVLGIGWSAETIAVLRRRPSPVAEKPSGKPASKPRWWGALRGALVIVISFGVFRWAPVANEGAQLAIAAACSLVALAGIRSRLVGAAAGRSAAIRVTQGISPRSPSGAT